MPNRVRVLEVNNADRVELEVDLPPEAGHL